MRIIVAVGVVGLMALASATGASRPAFAHGGGLDASGCHTNRKTGDYHCHRPQAAPARPVAPASSSRPGPRPAAGAYPNCAAARAAGAAPVRRGEPGYGLHLDRDGDGVACE